MFVIYLHIKFHIPNSNGPLVINVKLKTKLKFCKATMLLFHIPEKVNLNKYVYF
jgi:hypothetical protein